MATTDSNLAPEASDTTSQPSQASELPTSTAAAAAASAPPPPASEAPEAPSQPSEPPALAPAPVPGPRASELLRLHDLTLSKTLKTLSYENFAACFPTIARAAPGALRVLWGRIVERLETAGKKNFELILAERDVIRNLNTLDDLVAEAKRRKSRAVVDGEATVPYAHLSSLSFLSFPSLLPPAFHFHFHCFLLQCGLADL
jgi:kinetochore protein NNF1